MRSAARNDVAAAESLKQQVRAKVFHGKVCRSDPDMP